MVLAQSSLVECTNRSCDYTVFREEGSESVRHDLYFQCACLAYMTDSL